LTHHADVNSPTSPEISSSSTSAKEDEFLVDIGAVPCKLLGYTIYYLGISMFHWMSVMCFDLCWTFSRSR
jgi:hypothetical protein